MAAATVYLLDDVILYLILSEMHYVGMQYYNMLIASFLSVCTKDCSGPLSQKNRRINTNDQLLDKFNSDM